MKNSSHIPTTSVSPEKSMRVAHQSGHLVSSPGEKYIVVYSPERKPITILSENGDLRQFELAQPTGQLCLSIDSTGEHLAYLDPTSDQLHIFNIGLHQVVASKQYHRCVNVRFDEKGRLWVVHHGAEQFVICVYDIANWKMLGQTQIGDSYFFDGGAELHSGASDEVMFISIYSGQSEQEHYLCAIQDDGLSSQHLVAMDDNQLIFAAPNKQTLLALDHNNIEIAFSNTPVSRPHTRIAWPYFVEDECEDELPGYYGCYIDDQYFLAGSSEGRLFLIDTDEPEIKKEIQIDGHAPVHTSVKYPSLTDTCGYVSDLVYFGRLGSSVAFFFSEANESQACVVPISVIR